MLKPELAAEVSVEC